MSDAIVRVENLGKKYRLNHERKEKYTALRDVVANKVRQLRTKTLDSKRKSHQTPESFWALKDISFEIKSGQRVGIIGGNGAGKSTLLKVLSRITEPTAGLVELRGRVASLLEVGTGFHPELTGRENVFLNGAILGMSRIEILHRFDEIIEFSEVERFLDTPVKRYSSGMYVRLAFAVAAHLDPEILVIDEVLAVGDANFQKKCFGRMNEIARSGRTVLFVSHNMSAIQNLCEHVIHLSAGKLVMQGDANTVIQNYLDEFENEEQVSSLAKLPRKRGLGELIRITRCSLLGPNGEDTSRLLFGAPFSVLVKISSSVLLKNLSCVVQIDSFQRETIITSSSEFSSAILRTCQNGEVDVVAKFKDLRLMPGKYWITIGVRQGKVGLDELRHVRRFEISEISFGRVEPHPATWGHIQALPEWTVR